MGTNIHRLPVDFETTTDRGEAAAHVLALAMLPKLVEMQTFGHWGVRETTNDTFWLSSDVTAVPDGAPADFPGATYKFSVILALDEQGKFSLKRLMFHSWEEVGAPPAGLREHLIGIFAPLVPSETLPMTKDAAYAWLWDEDCYSGPLPAYDKDEFIVVNGTRTTDHPFFGWCMHLVTGKSYYDDEWGYGDEFTQCSECVNIIRTEPTGYGWQPDFYLGDGEILCKECCKKDADHILDDIVERSTERGRTTVTAVPSFIDPEEHGFKQLLWGLEYGLHPGQADRPDFILKWLHKQGVEAVCTIHPSQFTTGFDVYARWPDSRGHYDENDVWVDEPRELTDDEIEGLRRAMVQHSYGDGIWKHDVMAREFKQYPDPASLAQQGMREASKQGLNFVSINTTGDGPLVTDIRREVLGEEEGCSK